MWFEPLSRLKIILEKSELITVGRVENSDMLADELGCKLGSPLSTYFRIPLGAHYKFDVVSDGFEK